MVTVVVVVVMVVFLLKIALPLGKPVKGNFFFLSSVFKILNAKVKHG